MSDRDLHLDFVKGVLIIFMVIYHTMNYFSNASPEDYGYIRFVTGSFIFISGYIVSTAYEKKYQIDKQRVAKRLVVRGLKLLTIFTVLNLVINLAGLSNYKKIQFSMLQYVENLSAIYVSGNSRLAAFQILVPISYLLIVSPVYFIFHEFRKAMIAVTLCLAFCYTIYDMDSYNLSLCIIGLVGLSVGMLENKEMIYSINNRLIIFCSLIVSIGVIGYLSGNVLTYSLGILIILKLFYDLSKTLNLNKQVYQWIIILGQYSLVCYITQIAILHILYSLLLKQRWGLGFETISIFFVTNICLTGLCLFLKFMRNRYALMDKSYKLIFS